MRINRFALPALVTILVLGYRRRLLDAISHGIDRRIGWDKLPLPLAAPVLVGLRDRLRERNLHDTSGGTQAPRPSPPPDQRYLAARTIDGSYNDLRNPAMGMARTRFGRNIPLEHTKPEADEALLAPNPRLISRELLTRNTFQPAPTLNVLAAAWLQYATRDWFSHGRNQRENHWRIPLDADDPWHERPMRIERVSSDPTRPHDATAASPTFLNTETHWWDGSQIYGSDQLFHGMVRTGADGKVAIGPDGLIHVPPAYLIEIGSVAGWWVGLAMMFTLFGLEHNAICDRLKAEYPSWSDQDLFDKARLINAALMAKIHTLEWTPAVISHPTTKMAMRGNWWGLQGERLHKLLGRLSGSEVISGIPGSATDHHSAPYAMTEEFVTVYRMHPLIPDDYTFRSAVDDAVLGEYGLMDIAGLQAQGVLESIGMRDLLYSFGIAHPGQVALHNYPRALQQFTRPDGVTIDLAAIDILRSREVGVPRYTEFRRLLHMRPVETFEELTDNPKWAEELRRIYDDDIDKVDLMVGMFAEPKPAGFGFSDTAFRIFILMASRRLKSDRFFTVDYTPEVYTPLGMDWINNNTMVTVLRRQYPDLAPALEGVSNAFAPWARAGS